MDKNSRVLRWALVAMMIGMAIYYFSVKPVNNNATSRSNLIESIKQHWPDLAILTDVKSKQYFTDEWNNDFVRPKATPIKDDQLRRFLTILPVELHKYPTSLIKSDLHAIALSSSLSLYGIEYGGSNSGKRIYMTVLSAEQGYTDEYIRRTIHHEFSSILIRDHKFPLKEWREALPDGVKYNDSIDKEVKTIEAGRDISLASSKLLEQGFLSSYGLTNYINDVNTYAELLFVDPNELKRLSDKYKTIRVKYDLLIDFYKNLDIKYNWKF